MAALMNMKEFAVFCGLLLVLVSNVASQCTVPEHFHGQYFSIETGADTDTTINAKFLEHQRFRGECLARWDDNSTLDSSNIHDSKIVFHDKQSGCYKCFHMVFRTLNIVQYKMSDCQTLRPDPLMSICEDIPQYSDFNTYFRKNYETVNCKTTFEGVYNFTYEWNEGGGGVCSTPLSTIVACQLPGSPYVDNQVFEMNFGKCPDVSTSTEENIRFLCMGSWTDDAGLVWSAVSNVIADAWREKFRCMLTQYGQEEGDNKVRYTMSWWADCSELKSPYEGPVRLMLQPVIGDFQLANIAPTCNFPTNFSGHWFHNGEYDVDVDINSTHIYFKTKLDEFSYKESYFTCLMASGTRFLTMAVTVGKCEVDYLCWDMLPRHHSIIRWRMGKPYRLTSMEMAMGNYELFMFRQACSWYSFTTDRNDINWNYKTFLLNPPVPMPCPIRGRYFFEQSGPETELIRTRIQGITERPRHMIDCTEYVTEFKSCDMNPTKIQLDAEYCETVDHTGRPIGEYDEPDWELSCVGHWDEDWKSYMVTWDPEDPTSAYRCWIYEREDWRFIAMSRSTRASCLPTQHARSDDPVEGGSLALKLTENERLYDDCAQNYQRGDPWAPSMSELIDWNAAPSSGIHCIYITILSVAIHFIYFL